MSELNQQISNLRLLFSQLSQRDQMLAMGGIAGGFLAFLLILFLVLSSSISAAERRVKSKGNTLRQVLALQGNYKQQKSAQDRVLRELKRNKKIRLVSIMEDAARMAGVEIGRLQPKKGTANDDGIVEHRVEVQVTKLSIDRLEEFLNRIKKKIPKSVVIRRLQVKKPYRKETLDVEINISAYSAEG